MSEIVLKMTEALYYKYWGKASSDNESVAGYHLLPYHCLDVAAVGWQLLSPDKPLCKQLAKQLHVEPEWLRTLFVFCLALHGGQICPGFSGFETGLVG
jgi:CRISPR-associated endonuclease/helicase Cas3